MIIEGLNNIITDLKSKLNNNKPEYNVNSEIINKLSKELNALETQQNKLYDLLEQGVYTSAVFVMRNEALAEKRKKLEEAFAKAKEISQTAVNYQEMIVSLSEAVDVIRNPDISPKRKNVLLRSVIKEIEYSRKKEDSRSNYDPPISISISLTF